MIAREWRARTEDEQAAEAYRRVFATEVAAGLREVDGFRRGYLLARPDHDSVEIRTLTLFDSLESVRGFAGDGYRNEHVTPAARAVLLGSDSFIHHFTVLTTLTPD